ncbi:unnamed protein product [Knipowitschia caucasica]
MVRLSPLLLLCCAAVSVTAAPAGGERTRTGTRTRAEPGRMWHITDLHLDPSYHVTSDPAHVCASSKGAAAVAPGVYGDYLCDAPYRLIQEALKTLGTMVQEGDYVIWTGDSPPHVPPSDLSFDLVVEILSNVTSTVRLALPNVTVFPAVGNHDYWPQDQMPDRPNALYAAAARLWAPWLQQEALDSLLTGGFYSQLVHPGLRIISLNTILYYGPNHQVTSSDPAGQFTWLERTLGSAEKNQEKVYIIAHVPVGFLPYARNVTAMKSEHNERLTAIFLRFSHVIRGQFYGHTHRDSVMVMRDHTGAALSSAFVSPAVTPIRNVNEKFSNNPTFRVYLFDQFYQIQDLWQFFLNLTEANVQQRALWRLEYVMTEAFGLKDLSPDSLLGLGQSLVPPESRTFQTYFNHFTAAYSPGARCEGRCKVDQVCAVLNVDQRGYKDCTGTGLNQV